MSVIGKVTNRLKKVIYKHRAHYSSQGKNPERRVTKNHKYPLTAIFFPFKHVCFKRMWKSCTLDITCHCIHQIFEHFQNPLYQDRRQMFLLHLYPIPVELPKPIFLRKIFKQLELYLEMAGYIRPTDKSHIPVKSVYLLSQYHACAPHQNL